MSMSYEFSWKGDGLSLNEDWIYMMVIQILNLAQLLRHRAALPPAALSGPAAALDGLQLRLGHVQVRPKQLWGHPYMTPTKMANFQVKYIR